MKKKRFIKCICCTEMIIILIFTTVLTNAVSISSNALTPGGIISDGIYSLQNLDTGEYLDIQGDSYLTNKHIQIYNYGVAPNTEQERSGLFKFTHIENDGYLIRTMRNNCNTFVRCNDNTVKTEHIDPVDNNNDISLRWYLSDAGDNYYYLKVYNMEMYLCAPDTNLSTDKYCITENKTTACDRAKWKLTSYSGSSMLGLRVNYLEPQIMNMGTYRWISDNDFETAYFYSTNMTIHDRGTLTDFWLTTVSGDSSVIATKLSNYLIGVSGKCGMVSVVAQFTNATSLPFNIYIKPTSGEYFFLQNIDNDIGCVESMGTYSEKSAFDYDDNQIWKRTIAVSGSSLYYIQDMNGYYLTAPNSTTSGDAINLSQSLMTGSDYFRQIWLFNDAALENSKKIRALSMTNLWLNINNSDILTQGSYISDDTYNDEFNVVMLGTNVVYHRTFADFTDIDLSEIIKNLYPHYNGFELIHLKNQLGDNITPDDSDACFNIALSMLENSKVMVFGGHADPKRIRISDYNQPHWITSTHLNDPNLDLTDVDIVIFDGCSTAGNPLSGFNLPTAAYAAGAKVAIGWTESVYSSNQKVWLNRFFELMNTIDDDTGQFYTAKKALDTVNDNTNNSSNTADIMGTNIYLHFN